MFGPASLGVREGPLVLALSGSVSPVVTLAPPLSSRRSVGPLLAAAAATPRLFALLGLKGCSRLETVESGRARSRLFSWMAESP